MPTNGLTPIQQIEYCLIIVYPLLHQWPAAFSEMKVC